MNHRDDDIAKAIKVRDVNGLSAIFMERDRPAIRQGFKTETELWDRAYASSFYKARGN